MHKDVHKDVYKVYILGNNPSLPVAKVFSLGSVRIDRHFILSKQIHLWEVLRFSFQKTTSPNWKLPRWFLGGFMGFQQIISSFIGSENTIESMAPKNPAPPAGFPNRLTAVQLT